MHIFACIKYFISMRLLKKTQYYFLILLPFCFRGFDFWRVYFEQFQLFFTVQIQESQIFKAKVKCMMAVWQDYWWFCAVLLQQLQSIIILSTLCISKTMREIDAILPAFRQGNWGRGIGKDISKFSSLLILWWLQKPGRSWLISILGLGCFPDSKRDLFAAGTKAGTGKDWPWWESGKIVMPCTHAQCLFELDGFCADRSSCATPLIW